MKKLAITYVIVIFLPIIAQAVDSFPKKGDILLWWNPTYPILMFKFVPTLPWDLYYNTHVWQHADLVIDDDGELRTSIQGKGVSNSTIRRRNKRFKLCCIIRNDKLTDEEIDFIVDRSFKDEGAYDWGGYWGTFLDIFFLLGRQDVFVTIVQHPDLLYCSEAISKWCTLGIKHPSPLDLYWYAQDPETEWEIK